MFNFPCTNTTITHWYKVANLAKTMVGGEPILANPTLITHRVWFEETKQYSRETGGDNWRGDAIVIASLLDGIVEGDILTINAQNWRVENLEKINSIPFQTGKKIQQMELILIRN